MGAPSAMRETLPAMREPPPAMREPVPAAGIRAKVFKVLLIQDDIIAHVGS